MKTLKIIQIILLSLIVLFLLGIFTLGVTYSFRNRNSTTNNSQRENFGFSFSFDGFSQGKLVEQYSEEFSSKNIKELTTNLASSDIVIRKSSNNKIKVVIYAPENQKEADRVTVSEMDSILDIFQPKNIGFNFWGWNQSSRIEIWLPKDFDQTLHLKSISGDISSEIDLDLQEINLFTTSGDIHVLSIISKTDIEIKTISGTIDGNELQADQIIIYSTSGDIKIKSVEGDLESRSISGEIEIDSLKGSLDVKTTSGDIEIDNFYSETNNKITSISGEIAIYLVPKMNLKVEGKTVSGSIQTQSEEKEPFSKGKFNFTIGTEAKADIYISTISGDITIR